MHSSPPLLSFAFQGAEDGTLHFYVRVVSCFQAQVHVRAHAAMEALDQNARL